MSSLQEQLRVRTKRFAIHIVQLFRCVRRTDEARILARQLLRARSKAEFVSKMGTVVEEADETVFWLELLVKTGILPQARVKDLLCEANELVAIFAASRRTAMKVGDGLMTR